MPVCEVSGHVRPTSWRTSLHWLLVLLFLLLLYAVGPGRRMTEGGSCFGQLAKAGLAERPTLKSVDVSCSSDAFLTLFFLY